MSVQTAKFEFEGSQYEVEAKPGLLQIFPLDEDYAIVSGYRDEFETSLEDKEFAQRLYDKAQTIMSRNARMTLKKSEDPTSSIHYSIEIDGIIYQIVQITYEDVTQLVLIYDTTKGFVVGEAKLEMDHWGCDYHELIVNKDYMSEELGESIMKFIVDKQEEIMELCEDQY
jgi:hypothetical protein